MTEEQLHIYIEFYPLKGREPVFRNTNIRVLHIIDDFAKGMTFEEVLAEHKELTKEHIQACFVYIKSKMGEMDNLPLYIATGYFPFWRYLFPKWNRKSKKQG